MIINKKFKFTFFLSSTPKKKICQGHFNQCTFPAVRYNLPYFSYTSAKTLLSINILYTVIFPGRM